MHPSLLGFRNALTLGLLMVFCGCSARKTLIDMRTMPVWSPTDTATSCIVEVAGHYAYRAKFPDENGIDRRLKYEFSSSYQPDHLPSRFFDFHERLLVNLQFDACRKSPELNGLWLRLQEILPDSRGQERGQNTPTRDSLLLTIDSTRIPSDLRTYATTSLRILQVGQEDLYSWSLRLGQALEEAKESGTWQGATKSENLWLLNHAWLPNRPRTLVMQSTTHWGSKTIVDTFTIDMDAKRLHAGFRP